MTYFIAYLIFINLLALILTVYDKLAAIHGRTRVSEHTLMLIAICGGGVAMVLVMLLIRHKTRKPLFMIGIPTAILLELLVLYMVIRYVIHL